MFPIIVINVKFSLKDLDDPEKLGESSTFPQKSEMPQPVQTSPLPILPAFPDVVDVSFFENIYVNIIANNIELYKN